MRTATKSPWKLEYSGSTPNTSRVEPGIHRLILFGGYCRPITPERAFRIGIAVDLALEIADEEVVAFTPDNEVRRHQYLAAAAGRIDDEHRRRIPGRVAAQGFDDSKP